MDPAEITILWVLEIKPRDLHMAINCITDPRWNNNLNLEREAQKSLAPVQVSGNQHLDPKNLVPRNNLSLCMCVFICIYVCSCGCQRLILDIFDVFLHLVKVRSHLNPELIWLASLVWDYRQVPCPSSIYIGTGESNSIPEHLCIKDLYLQNYLLFLQYLTTKSYSFKFLNIWF